MPFHLSGSDAMHFEASWIDDAKTVASPARVHADLAARGRILDGVDDQIIQCPLHLERIELR